MSFRTQTELTLNITGGALTYGGLIYSLYADGTHTYYSFDDVTFNTSSNAGRYVTVNTDDASVLKLEAGKYYTVLSGTATSGASVKQLSFVATQHVP